MTRLAVLTALLLLLLLWLPAGRAAAKLCQLQVRFDPHPPTARRNFTFEFSVSSIDQQHERNDPLCILPAGGRVLHLYAVPPGMARANVLGDESGIPFRQLFPGALSVELIQVDPWLFRNTLTFDRSGTWKLSIEDGPSFLWRGQQEVLRSALPSA